MIADKTLQDLTMYEEAMEVTIADKNAFLTSYNNEVKKAAALAAATNHVDNVLGLEYVTWDGVSDITFPKVTMTPAQFRAHLAAKHHYHDNGEILLVTQGTTVVQMQCCAIEGCEPLTEITAAQLAADLRDMHIQQYAEEAMFKDTLLEVGTL